MGQLGPDNGPDWSRCSTAKHLKRWPHPACQPGEPYTISADRAPSNAKVGGSSGGPSPVWLLDRYNQLIRDGWFPSQAKEILSTLLMGEHFHTPFGAKLRLKKNQDDRLIVMLDGDKLTRKVPNSIATRILTPNPYLIDQRAFEQRMDAAAHSEQQRDRCWKGRDDQR